MIPLLLLGHALAGEVSGIIFDDTGAPLVEAVVSVDGRADTPAVRTDADGYFVVSLPEGTWQLVVHPQGQPRLTMQPLRVVDDQVTEVLITVTDSGLQLIAEEPAAPNEVVDASVAQGVVDGTVSTVGGLPIAGARVFVRGFAAETQTDEQGRFSLTLPADVHELSVLMPGYSTQAVPDIAVPEDGVARVAVELVEAGAMMDAFVVLMPRISGGTATLIAERQDSSELVDTVSAEEMSRRGDSSAASALKRVTGLTVVGGKYVYVRGLGERYSATLLNGMSLPSPEPERRVVPLDLFPTAMLDSVVIQKTFSPSMPAEFGGGVVQLRTRGAPDGPLLNIGISGNYLHNTSFRQVFTSNDPGATDGFGFGGAHRALPETVAAAVEEAPLTLASTLPGSQGYTAAELEALGEAMPNRWGLATTAALPNVSTSVVSGNGWRLGEDSKLGVLGGLTFSNGWQRKAYTNTAYGLNGDALRVVNSYDFEDAENTIRLGGLFEVSGELSAAHTLRSTTLLTRDAEASARQYTGTNQDIGAEIRVQRLRWVERQLLVQQLAGTHRFASAGDLGVDWRYALSIADRIEPDRRDLLQVENPDAPTGWQLRTQGGGNELFFSVLDDTNHDMGVDVHVPFGAPDVDGALGGEIRVGGSMVQRVRQVDTRRFSYVLKSGGEEAQGFVQAAPESIFTEQSISPDVFQFEEQTQATDNYTAAQQMNGLYVAGESTLPWRLQAIAGVRREHSRQEVRTFQLFTTEPVEEIADLETTDWLPSVTLTRRLDAPDSERRMQVRAGYGKTLSRPDFRELSPAVFNDVVGGREVAGNAALRRATIDNYDVRWEWYFSGDESISLGGFYKHFTDPIETIVVVSSVSRVSYANAVNADNLGAEIEFRKSLQLVDGAPRWLQDTYFSGNAAWIHSQVDLGESAGNQTSDVRALQGQSPYVLNLQLTHEGMDSPVSAAILYNVFGPRIAQVGDGGLPDTYEQPMQRLDVSASLQVAESWRVKMSARNLLDSPSVFTVGDEVVSVVRLGWSVGIGLTWAPTLDADAS